MPFLDCSWLYHTLEDSLDEVIRAQDQKMIKELVIYLLDSYAKQTDNEIDDQIVDLVKCKLFNEALPKDNVFTVMKRLANFLPDCEYKSELIGGITYIQDNFDKPFETLSSESSESQHKIVKDDDTYDTYFDESVDNSSQSTNKIPIASRKQSMDTSL